MIRSVLALRAAPGSGALLEDFYAEHRFLERARAFPGCRDAVLLRSVSTESPADLTTHLVVADWDSAADYWRWVDEPWRGALAGQLADLLDLDDAGPIVGRLYEFV